MSDPTHLEKFVCIVGLPRSGTTLLTALLDAHPRFGLYYEPWNASRRARPAVPADAAAFCRAMEARFGVALPAAARVTGFKETTILPGAVAWAAATAEAVARALPVHVVWIYRDPIHCFLSKIEAARAWWGHADARVSAESLERYLHEILPGVRALHELGEAHDGLVVDYDELARDPEGVLGALMAELGERFDAAQLAYHEAGPQPHKVMGDVGLARSPEPVTAARTASRARERRARAELIDAVLERDAFAEVRRTSERLAKLAPLGRVRRAGGRDGEGGGRSG